MIDVNPAKVGVENPVRRRREQHPFESWAELEALAATIGPRYGPMILFAAATGLRPAEWIALEKRDVDREERVVYVRRSFTRRELNTPGAGARCARPDQGRRRLAAALSGRAGWLSRYPPLPSVPVAAGTERGGH